MLLRAEDLISRLDNALSVNSQRLARADHKPAPTTAVHKGSWRPDNLLLKVTRQGFLSLLSCDHLLSPPFAQSWHSS
jgi:hypothetical protein